MTDTVPLVEIAAALGVTRQAANTRAKKEAWPFEAVPVRGGYRRLYAIAKLPKPVAQAVFMHLTAGGHDALEQGNDRSGGSQAGGGEAASRRAGGAGRALAPRVLDRDDAGRAGGTGLVPRTDAPVGRPGYLDPAELDDRQQITLEARARLRQFVEAYPGGVKAALTHLNVAHAGGMLPGPLAWAYAHCHDKRRDGQKLAPKTYYTWLTNLRERGTLAPGKKLANRRILPWHAPAVALRQRPQGSTLRWLHEQLVGLGHEVSYDQVARFFRDQFSQLDQLKGRYTGSQLRARTFYQHRSSAGMVPWQEIHADGWNTHFTAPHPVTSEYVTYEVWHAHDVATRFVPPFSVGLTENFEVIAKCIENTIRAGGNMRFLQTDSTRIVKLSDRLKTDPTTALADRAGFTIVHPQTVGNSQANGIAENFNTWLDRESRELATYQHPKRMDELSFKRGRKLTAAMVKAANAGDLATMHAKRHELERANKGLVLTSFEGACAWLEQKRQKWNHRPHRALPKVRGDDGKLRHQTPFEALMQHIEAGWEADLPDLAPAELERHLVDTFRPHVRIKVSRGSVSPYGGMRYRHAALDEWLGKEVVVAFDVTDWRQVWVKSLQGELICIADFVAATGYRTLSAQEAAEEKRTAARIRAKERAIERERASLAPALEHDDLAALDHKVIHITPKPTPLRDVSEVLAEMDAANPAPDDAPKAREMSWEETKMWLYGDGKDLREEETPPEEVAAR